MTNKVKGAVGAHPVLAGLGVLVLVCAGVGAFVYNQMFGLQTTVVYFGVPDAPTLTATNNETIYRLDASRSLITNYAASDPSADRFRYRSLAAGDCPRV